MGFGNSRAGRWQLRLLFTISFGSGLTLAMCLLVVIFGFNNKSGLWSPAGRYKIPCHRQALFVTALQSVIATLPDGATKNDKLSKLKRAGLKQFLLNQKDKNFGGVSLLTLELDIARAQTEIDEIDTFITSVTTKKAAL